MVFNDTAGKQGIIQACETYVFGGGGYGRISGDANTLATFTRNANKALNRVVSLILKSDYRWQYDDSNNTTSPIGNTNLVANQQDYGFAPEHLNVLRVEVKDEGGNWRHVTPIDQADLFDQSLTDYLKTSGTPIYYDKIGASIFLYPKPSYNSTGGLKLHFQRGPSFFTVSDTTKEPGFASTFHDLIPLWASYDYAYPEGLAVAASLRGEIQVMENELVEFYSKRDRDDHIRLRPRSLGSFK